MKNISTVICVVALMSSSVLAQDSNTPQPKKGGLGHDAKVAGSDVKKGTVGVFKDFGKGVKKVGGGIDKGAKATVRGTEKGAGVVGSDTKKGLSKITPHKKTPNTQTPSTSQ